MYHQIFRIADTPEIELLKQEILDDIFEKNMKKMIVILQN